MDARSHSAPRSAEEDPARFSAGIGSGHRMLGELGQEMAQAIGRRRSYRSTRVVFALAGASYALLPLGPALGKPHRGDASVSPRSPGTHTRPPSLALLSAARSSLASRRSSLAQVQPNRLEAPEEKRMYSAQAAEETTT